MLARTSILRSRRFVLSRYANLTYGLRTNATSSLKKLQNLDPSTYDFIKHELGNDVKATEALPFDKIRHSETFGQLVVSERLKEHKQLNEDQSDKHVRIQEDDFEDEISPYRNPDGSLKQGDNSEEARLHPLTLEGRVDRNVTVLPTEIAKVINKNILSTSRPDKLRERAANIFKSLSSDQILLAPESALDCDAHIASLFLQNYSHAHHVLLELQKRVGKDKFNPQSVLDIGHGPATGMVALNEIMGNEWVPEEKDVYVVGRSNYEMKKRAKIILSRQLNENLVEYEVPDENEDIQGSKNEGVSPEENVLEKEKPEVDDYVGPVDASKIQIKTKLRDSLPVSKRYDLIMVNQALLTREYSFPRDIDTNIHMILKLLKPNGHLVLVERGNALGFETIARARQVMIRPESYQNERGKIPRPYIKGSSLKPQKLKKEDQLIDDNDIKYEEELFKQLEDEDFEDEDLEFTEDEKIAAQFKEESLLDFEKEINSKYGEVKEEDLKFEYEGGDEYEVVPLDSGEPPLSHSTLNADSVDYHISIIAPCSHHGKCPLQLGDPKYYKISSHKHRFNFCSFNKTVERPKYTMELKKGRRLATKWDKTAEDGFGLDNFLRNSLKKLGGTGRPGSNNTETGSFSYLIAQRSPNDVESIKNIEYERSHNSSTDIDEQDPKNWPRIISHPGKVKKNVKLTVSAPSGKIEIWQIPKSLGKQVYHDARKLARGDLWPSPLGKKGVIVKNSLSDEKKEKLEAILKTQKKSFLKEQRKKDWKKVTTADSTYFDDDIVTMADSIASSLEMTKKYKQQGKKAKFDVDLKKYEGK